MASAFNEDKIHIRSLRVYYDSDTYTKVVEKPYLVQYESQHFRCKAKLELEESFAKSHWTIGLVQACDSMILENRYGRSGSSLWEFHPLKAGYHEMVNDSDGRQYPFYSKNTSRIEVLKGTVPESQVKLYFGDHFYPTVAWELPYCSEGLTDVIRLQDFWVWLVAIRRHKANSDHFRANREEIILLKTMRWRYNLHLSFDPHQQLGNRLRWVKDKQRERPVVMETDTPIPLSAVHPPHCNAAQSLIWYPRAQTERQALLVPPKQSIVPWSKWVQEMLPTVDTAQLETPSSLTLCPLWTADTAATRGAGSSPTSVSAPKRRRLSALSNAFSTAKAQSRNNRSRK